jgi:autotransporter passenger strand-loop-strand repeat protein
MNRVFASGIPALGGYVDRSKIIDEIYEAAVIPELWTRTLDCMAEVAGGSFVSHGGKVYVSSGGFVSATIDSGGKQFILAGGSALGDVVTSGNETVSSGGIASSGSTGTVVSDPPTGVTTDLNSIAPMVAHNT